MHDIITPSWLPLLVKERLFACTSLKKKKLFTKKNDSSLIQLVVTYIYLAILKKSILVHIYSCPFYDERPIKFACWEYFSAKINITAVNMASYFNYIVIDALLSEEIHCIHHVAKINVVLFLNNLMASV